jgi:hypothetical protein
MELINLSPTFVPYQSHKETKPLFEGLVEAADKLSEPSKGKEIFGEILRGVEGLSKQEKIVQLENAFSKYDALHLEFTVRPNLLKEGYSASANQIANIQNNAEEIKNTIKAHLESLYSKESINPLAGFSRQSIQQPQRSNVSTNSSLTSSTRHTSANSILQPQRDNLVIDSDDIDLFDESYTTLDSVHNRYLWDDNTI